MEHHARTLLHVCPDRKLAGSRGRVVTAIGYEVVWAQSESAAIFEISMGRCGILLLCHLLPEAVRVGLTDYLHTKCPQPYIVAVVAHEEAAYPTRAHARFLYSANHAGLAVLLRQRLAA